MLDWAKYWNGSEHVLHLNDSSTDKSDFGQVRFWQNWGKSAWSRNKKCFVPYSHYLKRSNVVRLFQKKTCISAWTYSRNGSQKTFIYLWLNHFQKLFMCKRAAIRKQKKQELFFVSVGALVSLRACQSLRGSFLPIVKLIKKTANLPASHPCNWEVVTVWLCKTYTSGCVGHAPMWS